MDRPASNVTPISTKSGLEEFLGKLGITEDMINNVKNVDVEESLNTARDYLRSSGDKAKTFAKENPAKVAVGAVLLIVGTGLLISALKRD
jgi:heterodisulfide reductase subunit A-like polyferredoxin